MKKVFKVFFHPVTVLNLTFVGTLGLIQVVHTNAHLNLETDVHGHVHRALKKNPELARSACYELN